CGAFFLMAKPVESRLTFIFFDCSISQKRKKCSFNSASPPDITTCRVPNLCKLSSSPSMSFSVSCFRFLLSFQISHITQRQLQALCGISITIGSALILCVCSVRYRLKVWYGDCNNKILSFLMQRSVISCWLNV